MTQRSQMNPRNQARSKHGDGLKGVSRKSAASAKPARKAGGSVYVRSKGAQAPKSKTSRKVERALNTGTSKEGRARERRREQALVSTVNEMPEYKRLRRIWWVLLAIAIVAVGLSFALGQLRNAGSEPAFLQANHDFIAGVLLIVGYGGIIAALYIDLGKIRKLRKLQEEKARSLTKNQRRKLDAAIEASDKAHEAQRAQRKANRRFPWSKKDAPAAQPETVGAVKPEESVD